MELDQSIFDLWSKYQKVKPEGAPDIVLDGWCCMVGVWVTATGELPIVYRLEFIGTELEAALWRIMQFVAWAIKNDTPKGYWSCCSECGNETLSNEYGSATWCEMTSKDWIKEADEILDGLANETSDDEDPVVRENGG